MEYKVVIPIILSMIGAGIAWYQAIKATKAHREVKFQAFYSRFDRANQVIIDYPEILQEVHGLDIGLKECRNIGYLSVLMDAFQHFYGQPPKSYSLEALQKKSTFLDKIFFIPANKERWKHLKKIYYGQEDYDTKFISVIDKKFEASIQKKVE